MKKVFILVTSAALLVLSCKKKDTKVEDVVIEEIETAPEQPIESKTSSITDTTNASDKNIEASSTTPKTQTSSKKNTESTSSKENSEEIFKNPTVKAQPKNGMAEFYKQFANKFHAPDVDSKTDKIKVILNFVIEKDGSFSEIKILKDSLGAGKEAIRVLNTMENWEPAKHEGKAVRYVFTLPITIQVTQ